MFINDETQRQVLPILAKTAITPTVDAQQRASSQLQLNPGQQVTAEIVSNLPNSLYLARIAGEMYQLEIPLNVQPGETLELTYVTADPRVTFQVQRPELGESVRLSSMGKWLADVVGNAPSPSGPQEPLLDHPEQGAAQLASRLKSALTQGGHFYEAHLAQWAGGRLSLKELLKEPQGKLSPLLFEGEGEGGDPDDGGVAGFADNRTLPQIKEQLALLSSGVHSWQGEAWPGQEMKLAISEKDPEQWEQGVEAKLALELPRLGGVEARLSFGSDGLSLELVCDRPGVSEILKQGSPELRSALASHGMKLNRMAAKDV